LLKLGKVRYEPVGIISFEPSDWNCGNRSRARSGNTLCFETSRYYRRYPPVGPPTTSRMLSLSRSLANTLDPDVSSRVLEAIWHVFAEPGTIPGNHVRSEQFDLEAAVVL
jgi:hypothetical protein